MADCYHSTTSEAVDLQLRQSTTLKVVLIINVVMFGVEIAAGLMAGSTALLADSLDMLGDALVYSFSLYVVGRGPRWKTASATIKGGIMALFGLFVLLQGIHGALHPDTPMFDVMAATGLLALAANTACLLMLTRHRQEDINMRSVWLCSRNDVIANLAVLFAALGVWLLDTGWPDLVVGMAIAALFLRSAVQVLGETAGEAKLSLKRGRFKPAGPAPPALAAPGRRSRPCR